MSDDHDHKPASNDHGSDGGHGGGGHGKKHGGAPHGPHEEHAEGAPEWLISFADNTALMMGFFVILLAMNMAPKGGTPAAQSDSQAAKESGQTPESLDWALGVREAFNNPVDINSKNPRDRILAMRMRERMKSKGQADDAGIEGQHDKSQSLRPSPNSGLVASIPFVAKSAVLTDEGLRTIGQTLPRLKGKLLIVEIRGHISAAENGADPSEGVRLSFDRALAVGNELASRGLDRRQIRLIACGDTELLKRRAYSKLEHQVNERVEIIMTDEIVGNLPDMPDAR